MVKIFILFKMKQINFLIVIFCCLLGTCMMSCKDKKERDVYSIKVLAEHHVQELEINQLLEEFILSLDNDTIGVCYSLVMPKQTLLRLIKKETYATPGGINKVREILVKRYTLGLEYVDSCINDKKDDKDWLINNTVNEPINPIWEQIINE